MAITNRLSTKEVFDLLRSDLQKVEEELSRQTSAATRPIAEIGQYLQASGGKRLRPSLLLLSAKLCGYEGPASARLGAVVELIHTATLVHDDVIDRADTRRGRPSINSRWGNHLSVLAGDWLYMQAFNAALDERSFPILDLLISLTQVMVEGELLQLMALNKLDATEEGYLELAYRKTACLFSVCLKLGAILAGKPPEIEEKLGAYGINLGLAFQLTDDILDFTSTEQKLGKPVGNDFREGKVTLPMIYLLQKCAPEEALEIERAYGKRSFTTEHLEPIFDLMRRCGALDEARRKAANFAEQAKQALAVFPDSIYKDSLMALPDFIIERES